MFIIIILLTPSEANTLGSLAPRVTHAQGVPSPDGERPAAQEEREASPSGSCCLCHLPVPGTLPVAPQRTHCSVSLPAGLPALQP